MSIKTLTNLQNLDILCFFNGMLENPDEVKIQYVEGGKVNVTVGKSSTEIYYEASVVTAGVILLIRFICNQSGGWSKSKSYLCNFNAAAQKWTYTDDKAKVKDLHLKYLPVLYRITDEIKRGLQNHLHRIDYFQLS